MPVSHSVEVVGLKETINALRKIDPQLQKDFKADATAIAQPAINAAKAAYTQIPLSHMRYKWNDRGRKVFPFTVSGAQSGVKMRFDTRRNAVGVILIEQKNQAAAIFEGAGRKTTNRLGQSLDFVSSERGFAMAMPGRTRLIGPAVYKARRGIEGEMEKMVLKTINEIQKDLN
jgi:hypothetical protein